MLLWQWFDAEPPAGGAQPPVGGTVANFTATTPPRPAPIETFFDGEGGDVSLLDFSGKVVVLNLWATWCAPCVRELPSLDRLQAAMAGEGLAVVAVSVDRGGAETVRPYFDRLGIANLAIYVDTENRLGGILGLEVLPSTIIISRTGTMVGNLIGAAEWDAPEAQALLRHYLAAAAGNPP